MFSVLSLIAQKPPGEAEQGRCVGVKMQVAERGPRSLSRTWAPGGVRGVRSRSVTGWGWQPRAKRDSSTWKLVTYTGGCFDKWPWWRQREPGFSRLSGEKTQTNLVVLKGKQGDQCEIMVFAMDRCKNKYRSKRVCSSSHRGRPGTAPRPRP